MFFFVLLMATLSIYKWKFRVMRERRMEKIKYCTKFLCVWFPQKVHWIIIFFEIIIIGATLSQMTYSRNTIIFSQIFLNYFFGSLSHLPCDTRKSFWFCEYFVNILRVLNFLIRNTNFFPLQQHNLCSLQHKISLFSALHNEIFNFHQFLWIFDENRILHWKNFNSSSHLCCGNNKKWNLCSKKKKIRGEEQVSEWEREWKRERERKKKIFFKTELKS